MKLSFKKEPREKGLAGVANPYPETTIKGDGLKIGRISPPRGRFRWTVALAAKERATENCLWGWCFFSQNHETEEAAREWLKTNFERICKRWTIYQFED